MNKIFAHVGVAAIVTLGISECHMIEPDIAFAEEHEPQTLNIEPHFDFLSQAIWQPTFERGSFKVIEDAYPWLDPEKSSMQMDTEELKSILRKVGFEGYSLRMAQAIIFLESTRRQYAHNPNADTGDNSYGLFQINMFRGLEEQRLKTYNLENNEELFDAETNARIAFDISNGGKDWSAWTTYPKAKTIVGNYSS